MKSIINFSLAILFLAVAACNKNLTVLPQNDITPDQIKTSEDVKAVLGGAYSLLQNGNAFGERYILMADLLASKNQINFVGTFTEYRQFENKTLLSNNGEVTGFWENAYDIINTVNTVIDKASLVNENERNNVIGQAKFIRGTVYFELVNFYSQPYSGGNASTDLGVPIMTAPTYAIDSTNNYYVSRATLEEVYQQILEDLQDADSKLDPSNGSLANKYSAEAELSRVYMEMGNYKQAATMANQVIQQTGLFQLTPVYASAFNNNGNSSEDVFAIQQSSQSNAGTSNNGLTTFYAPTTNPSLPAASSGRGDVQVAKGYLKIFDANDFRGTFFYTGTSIAGHNGTYPEKWYQFYKAIPVIRLAEMYLTRGEANLHTGSNIGGVSPLDDINTIRHRSTADSLTSVSVSDFVDERFRELGFEGDRVWTLKRLKMDVDGLPFNDNSLVLPIPQREMDVNKNLVQNPGY